MAKGKQSKGNAYVSKGKIGTNRQLSKQLRRERTPWSIETAKRDAWLKGRNVMLTVPNPDKNNTKESFVRIPASEVWGYAKSGRHQYRM